MGTTHSYWPYKPADDSVVWYIGVCLRCGFMCLQPIAERKPFVKPRGCFAQCSDCHVLGLCEREMETFKYLSDHTKPVT